MNLKLNIIVPWEIGKLIVLYVKFSIAHVLNL
jgi:hypothetical protein